MARKVVTGSEAVETGIFETAKGAAKGSVLGSFTGVLTGAGIGSLLFLIQPWLTGIAAVAGLVIGGVAAGTAVGALTGLAVGIGSVAAAGAVAGGFSGLAIGTGLGIGGGMALGALKGGEKVSARQKSLDIESGIEARQQQSTVAKNAAAMAEKASFVSYQNGDRNGYIRCRQDFINELQQAALEQQMIQQHEAEGKAQFADRIKSEKQAAPAKEETKNEKLDPSNFRKLGDGFAKTEDLRAAAAAGQVPTVGA